MSQSPYRQAGYRLRFDWGLSGAREIAEQSWVVAVVDVLSFTTTLTVAMDRGVEVFPYRWRDESALGFAKRHGAVLAVGRSQARAGDVSLSPQTLRAAGDIRRLVLPSPNGSTIAVSMAGLGGEVIGVSLRNSTAAAKWTAARLGQGSSGVAVVAAGEQWPHGGLRPAVEDLWGAGAYLAALRAYWPGSRSPEAEAAVAAFERVSGDLPQQLHASASGRELAAAGYSHDVDIAGETDRSEAVPVLLEHSFRPGAV
ncbi:2-phosphosulfolactate phosphatase [Amycolatopsis rhizosphaerae]|uniref:Probable 2-phosphosulfolactate phosphatase n=1 Tax=Amycolatopsis rhizosphaerae TaxID=2053003 RepID=A0A558DN91_9PSEU|nr:2-phosphosulfolactate phosphatase [Amycolatopsis rhizosphaerae]TVT62486.1 2-phosphosulfolactate phosphatase [Amycolatopsis rhizosphaerae]